MEEEEEDEDAKRESAMDERDEFKKKALQKEVTKKEEEALCGPRLTKKIDDVEAIPQVNESFDYSMTDPLVDEIAYEPDTYSSTGVSSTKNSMM